MSNRILKHKIISAVLIIFIGLNIYSIAPIVKFYITKEPGKIELNQDIIKNLKQSRDPYFSFIVISDTSSGLFLCEASTLKIISRMNREDRFAKIPIDFAVNVGDVTFRGEPKHYKNYIKIKGVIKYPVLNAIGNHDDDTDNGQTGEKLFEDFCGSREFSFSYMNSFFIVLDNKDGDFSDAQFLWLEGELKKAVNAKHKFIFIHKPPFNPFQESWYRIETCPWSYKFLKLCESYKVSYVFSGHEHAYRESEFGGVKYVVCGGGGTLVTNPPWEGGDLNYIVVKVNRDYLSYEARKIFPPLWEYFIYYLWKDLVYIVRDILI